MNTSGLVTETMSMATGPVAECTVVNSGNRNVFIKSVEIHALSSSGWASIHKFSSKFDQHIPLKPGDDRHFVLVIDDSTSESFKKDNVVAAELLVLSPDSQLAREDVPWHWKFFDKEIEESNKANSADAKSRAAD